MKPTTLAEYVALRTAELEEVVHIAHDPHDRLDARTRLDEIHRIAAWQEVITDHPERPGVDL